MLKPQKIAYFILSAGIFILIFNTLLGSSIISKYDEVNGPYSMSKVTASMLDNGGASAPGAFSMDDIRNLEEFSYKDTDMTYSSEEKSQVSYEDNHVESKVYGVGDKYNMFHQIELKSGSFITPGNRNSKVAVIDETLSQALFNNNNVVGMYISLLGREFKIIGVTARDESVVQAFADDGWGTVYIPSEQLLEYDKDAKITSIEARTLTNSTTGQNGENMEQALSSIGKNPSNYKILDYYIEYRMVEQKGQLSIFIPGIVVIILLLISIKRRVREVFKDIKMSLKENYLMGALRRKIMELSLAALEIAAMAIFIAIIWNMISFNIYIPPEAIPDELIDVAFFTGLLKSLLQEGVKNMGYIPPFTEMISGILGIMQNWNLYIDLLAGIPLFYLGIKMLMFKGEDSVKNLLYLSAIVVFSAVLGPVLLAVFKMPVTVDVKGMLVVVTFIFLSAAYSFISSKNKAIPEAV